MKRWEVVGYQTRRLTIEVKAETEEEAKERADLFDEMVSPYWTEDFEYYEFEITHAREIEEEEE